MNFILRTLSKNGNGETNYALGDNYSLIHREWHPDAFKNIMKDNEDYAELDVYYAFVIDNSSKSRPIRLNTEEWNYIMTETGSTFANLSYKPIDK